MIFQQSGHEHKHSREVKTKTKGKMRGSNLFDRLPIEILELIVKPLREDAESHHDHEAPPSIKAIKSLRLLSRAVANLPSLNRVLFSFGSFFPIPEQIELLESLQLNRIGPYIRQVRFMNYPFPASVSKDSYKSLVTCPPHKPRQLALPTNFEENYKEFSQRARSAEECHKSERLRDVWAATIKCCRNVDTISLASLDAAYYDAWKLKLWSYYQDTLDLREDLKSSHQDFGDFAEEIALCGDQMIANVIHCLAMTGIAPQIIKLDIEMSADLDLAAIPRVEEVDFSHVHTLNIDTHFVISGERLQKIRDCGEEEDEKDQNEATLGNNCIYKLVNIIGNQAKVVRINESNAGLFEWPPKPDFHLKNLEVFEVRHVALVADQFARFLLSHSTLREVTIAQTDPQGGVPRGEAEEHWKTVFDALRTHPNELHVILDEIYMQCSEYGGEFNTHPKAAPDPNFKEENDPEKWDVMEDVGPYIQNEIPWTNFLQEHLGSPPN